MKFFILLMLGAVAFVPLCKADEEDKLPDTVEKILKDELETLEADKTKAILGWSKATVKYEVSVVYQYEFTSLADICKRIIERILKFFLEINGALKLIISAINKVLVTSEVKYIVSHHMRNDFYTMGSHRCVYMINDVKNAQMVYLFIYIEKQITLPCFNQCGVGVVNPAPRKDPNTFWQPTQPTSKPTECLQQCVTTCSCINPRKSFVHRRQLGPRKPIGPRPGPPYDK